MFFIKCSGSDINNFENTVVWEYCMLWSRNTVYCGLGILYIVVWEYCMLWSGNTACCGLGILYIVV